MDIIENDDKIVRRCDMPGVGSEDVDINRDDRQLMIRGKVQSRYNCRARVAGEFGVGDFHRTFRIGEAIDVERIAADLKNGALTPQFPKSEFVKPRKI